MIGVQLAGPGREVFHLTFSFGPNFSGALFSLLEPSWFGPRQLGQSSQSSIEGVRAQTVSSVMRLCF